MDDLENGFLETNQAYLRAAPPEAAQTQFTGLRSQETFNWGTDLWMSVVGVRKDGRAEGNFF